MKPKYPKTKGTKFMSKASLLVLLAQLTATLTAAPANPDPNINLWYLQPAQVWEEALPVGNGRLGAMVFGGVPEERLQLNEGNIWSGNRLKDYDRVGAYKYFPEIRKMIYDGKYKEAQALVKRRFSANGR